MTTCPKCGAHVKEGKAFCSNCGAQLDAPEPVRVEPTAPEFKETILAPPSPPSVVYAVRASRPRSLERKPASPVRRGFPWGRVARFASVVALLVGLFVFVLWLLD